MIKPKQEVTYINMSGMPNKATVVKVLQNGNVNVVAQSPSRVMREGYRPYSVTDVKLFAHDDPACRPKRDYCETIG